MADIASLVRDLVVANRILARESVVDAYGHVSVRHPTVPGHFLMARALAPQVRVNSLCPGGLLGSWTRKIMTAEQYQARVHQAETEFPLKRGIWPIDVARAALFLVADAVVMTGECLRMDAGEHLGANLIRA